MSIKPLSLNPINLAKPLRLAIYLIMLLAFCLTGIPTFAEAETKVYDYANLLTLEQIEALETTATELAQTYQMDIGIVTTNDSEGKSSQDYADDFYDYNSYGYGNGYDGLLFLIDMDNREIYISTCGKGIKYFTDLRINEMLDALFNDISNGDYYGTCTHFLKLTQSYLKKGIPNNQYSMEGEFSDPRSEYSPAYKREPFKTATGASLNARSITLSALVALLGSLLIALIVRIIVKRTYTHPRYTMPQTRPDDLSIHYTQREDHFVTSHTSRVKIETNNGPSGRSSTHHSSSGRSHGGGGRRF